MARRKADLVAHPVRTRILMALTGREMTTRQLARRLPDVPEPSLYHHLRLLVDGGLLTVVREERGPSAPSRVYTVDRSRARVAVEDLPEEERVAEQLRGLHTFLAGLEAHFRSHVATGDYDPERDPLHAFVEPLFVAPDEYPDLLRQLHAFLAPWRERGDHPGRRPLFFAHVGLPDRDPPSGE